jgi:hypothetical protein
MPAGYEEFELLEFRATERYQDWMETEGEPYEQPGVGDQHWDELFSRPEARQLMRQMAQEVRAEFRAGRTTEIAETEDGRLAPG